MGSHTETGIFIILSTLILLTFTGGLLLFLVQYRNRKLLHEKEKTMINEQHTRELLHTRLEIQEHTMQDIGREIHDNVGQKLTLGSIYANQLISANRYPEIREQITAIGNLLNESLTDLRSLSKSLVHADTDAAELEDLIRQECDRVSALRICTVQYRFNTTAFKISNTARSFILRIVQEFMQNSLKHSGCRTIGVDFAYDGESLAVAARDDGAGFGAGPGGGIGLSNMKKRAGLIGARFSLESEPGKGTLMTLTIPADKLTVS